MLRKTEILSGYLIDHASARNWPIEILFDKARDYPKEYCLSGKAIESGYVLVNYQSGIQLTDSYATPLIVDILLSTESEIGIQLRIERELHEDEMRSVLITEI